MAVVGGCPCGRRVEVAGRTFASRGSLPQETCQPMSDSLRVHVHQPADHTLVFGLAAHLVQHAVQVPQHFLQRHSVGAFQQHLGAFHISHTLHAHRHGWVDVDLQHQVGGRRVGAQLGFQCFAGGVQQGLGGFLAAGVGAQQGLVADGRQVGGGALGQLAGGKGRVVVFFRASNSGCVG